MIKESTYEMIPEQITSQLTIIACEAADSKFLTFFIDYWTDRHIKTVLTFYFLII